MKKFRQHMREMRKIKGLEDFTAMEKVNLCINHIEKIEFELERLGNEVKNPRDRK